MTFVIYYDFISAECFALSELLRALPAAPTTEWRGVQMEPDLPVPMLPADRWVHGRVEMELVEVRKAAPDLRVTVPPGRPNTRRALRAVASVGRMHPAKADALRMRLFQEYWWNGADLSDAVVLHRIAVAAGIPPWVDLEHQAAEADQVGWELQWQTERLGGVPRIISPDGKILWAVRDAAAVHEFIGAA